MKTSNENIHKFPEVKRKIVRVNIEITCPDNDIMHQLADSDTMSKVLSDNFGPFPVGSRVKVSATRFK